MIYSSLSFVYNDSFTFSLPILNTFICFYCLIAVAWASNTMLKRSAKSGHPVLFEILAGRLSAFHHWILCWLWVCHKSFLLCYVPSHFCKAFYHEWVLKCIKCLSCVCWDGHVVFVSSRVAACHIGCFAYIEPSLWPGDESSLVMVYDFFICLWIQFANILLSFFVSVFIKDTDL